MNGRAIFNNGKYERQWNLSSNAKCVRDTYRYSDGSGIFVVNKGVQTTGHDLVRHIWSSSTQHHRNIDLSNIHILHSAIDFTHVNTAQRHPWCKRCLLNDVAITHASGGIWWHCVHSEIQRLCALYRRIHSHQCKRRMRKYNNATFIWATLIHYLVMQTKFWQVQFWKLCFS